MNNQSNELLDDEYPLIIRPTLAKILGLNQSIIIQQIHYWVQHNKKNKSERHFRDGYYWTFNSYKDWKASNFGFWSESTIIRAIKDLEQKRVIIVGNFNKKGYDRTKWYRIDYDILGGLTKPYSQNDQMDYSERLDDEVNLTKPIPETTTEITTETTPIEEHPTHTNIKSIRSSIQERKELISVDFDYIKLDEATKRTQQRILEIRKELPAFDAFYIVRELISRLNTKRRATLKSLSLQYSSKIESLFERFEEYKIAPREYTKWFIDKGFIKVGFSWEYFCSTKFMDSFLAEQEFGEGKQPTLDYDEDKPSGDSINERLKKWKES